ncbi:MAG: hypothetical protein OES26_09585 [Gammaproteobacteria bacterium]|nr:hypothetical protein [Gammaproteobacteria bacterium]
MAVVNDAAAQFIEVGFVADDEAQHRIGMPDDVEFAFRNLYKVSV